MLFRAVKKTNDDSGEARLSRFGPKSTREPVHCASAAPFGNSNPEENLTRIAHRHVREPVAPDTSMAAATERPSIRDTDARPVASGTSLAGQLHSDAPIPIDILRRALPGRFAELEG